MSTSSERGQYAAEVRRVAFVNELPEPDASWKPLETTSLWERNRSVRLEHAIQRLGNMVVRGADVQPAALLLPQACGGTDVSGWKQLHASNIGRRRVALQDTARVANAGSPAASRGDGLPARLGATHSEGAAHPVQQPLPGAEADVADPLAAVEESPWAPTTGGAAVALSAPLMLTGDHGTPPAVADGSEPELRDRSGVSSPLEGRSDLDLGAQCFASAAPGANQPSGVACGRDGGRSGIVPLAMGTDTELAAFIAALYATP